MRIILIREEMQRTGDRSLCKKCGACAARCPSDAMEQKRFKSTQLLAIVDAALD